VEAGVSGFRCFVVDHPALFHLGIQQTDATDEQRAQIGTAAAGAFTVLQSRVARLHPHGQLGTRSVDEAATAFHALCEGLAALEIRGTLPAQAAEQLWRNALTALVHGLTAARPLDGRCADRDRQAAITGSP
jgi:lactam utilization protein B